MHRGSGGAWIENCQSNHTQTLFFEGVFMTYPDDPSSSQKPNLALMFFTWYRKILFIIESFQKQDYKLKIPKEYDCNTHSQCQHFGPTFPPSDLMPPSYPAFFSLTSKQKTDTITQWIRPSHDGPAPFHYSNPPPPSSKNQTSFSMGSTNTQWTTCP
ncbi:hypothetical protein O181_065520 [Austropuccinia psidii MF-1]|uniref:Uncharacterized protein n=1 Tax=Austropuccinia psidii MF-1 TaxID=1389203 RepID=A0A9Q3I465_9BASI|nr:hypothetical protein [Austropuccinia psidii MF-1]